DPAAGPLRTTGLNFRDRRDSRRAAGRERGHRRGRLPAPGPAARTRRRRPAMSTAKRQQTMAKRNRERSVEEKRTLKRLRKHAARSERAAGELRELDPYAVPSASVEPEPEGEPEAEAEPQAEAGPDAE